MPLNSSLKNQQEFLNLFYSPACIDSFSLTIKTKISLYILRIDSSSFDYEALYKNLGNASISYVLSRLRNEEYYKNQKVWEQVQEATKKFRNWGINEGEGGELLLYCFLESHLKAPKIISKMEIKDDSQDYIKGSDGIHLLRLDENNYQLIYGESKMIAKLEDDSKKTELANLVAPAQSLFVCAKLEDELKNLDEVDRTELLESYGQTESGLIQLIHAAYKTLGLQSYLTAGEVEVRAWTIHKGWTAPQAAGVIHTDFEKGFIAAQVVDYTDLVAAGSEIATKAAGKMRTEGKTYVMQPGDIVEFRFNV
jgi:ribosome-binding ATPase YchF (GTP1/OBG family)